MGKSLEISFLFQMIQHIPQLALFLLRMPSEVFGEEK